ncbi:MAG TPA: MBL fold metallo-hydrolase, partial [Solirubrobacteraceae bacterium]|nr:MBL fold metallo-hydrolase [Solirubrobacteraceae bacterium]
IRNLGLALSARESVGQPIHILLTHLHLDHIQGLMFFAPAFRPESEIIIWGPASPEASLRDRIARYISAPLAPVEVRELPSLVSFREAEPLEWDIGPARIHAQAVAHRGPTLGYRITADDCSLCYIPDHEPGLGAPLAELDDDWISGFELGRGASMLIHDCQYTDREYPHHLGWGHSPMSDALEFGHRVGAERLLMFHHDPLHTDADLDAIASEVSARWSDFGHAPAQVEVAAERRELAIEPAPARVP